MTEERCESRYMIGMGNEHELNSGTHEILLRCAESPYERRYRRGDFVSVYM